MYWTEDARPEAVDAQLSEMFLQPAPVSRTDPGFRLRFAFDPVEAGDVPEERLQVGFTGFDQRLL
ncbi:hypothetical protein C475_18711 [Halosimplex carlsbadense 2-9-1]|uniref:Uncharacterized protein n=1 Tax=Halosimplex carlsbadense 2-9-1 TaxID=797114 RepID=M0CEB6_9EURY|nr:hypothetical protein C475_18711 [Halosimplex carlsbadense 2-9-1]